MWGSTHSGSEGPPSRDPEVTAKQPVSSPATSLSLQGSLCCSQREREGEGCHSLVPRLCHFP